MDLPSENVLRHIVGRYARLHAAHGAAFDRPVLVQPTGTFFPDEFQGDAPSVARLLGRLTSYAPIAEDLAFELAVFAPEGAQGRGAARPHVAQLESWRWTGTA